MGKIKGNIAVIHIVMGKIFLDIILLVTSTDNEIIEAIVAVFLHNMP